MPEVNVVLRPLVFLKHLTVQFRVLDTSKALRTAATWSSICRTKPDSTFALVFNFRDLSRGALPYCIGEENLLPLLDGTLSERSDPFKGKLTFDLLGHVHRDIPSTNLSHAFKLAASVGLDTIVRVNGEIVHN